MVHDKSAVWFWIRLGLIQDSDGLCRLSICMSQKIPLKVHNDVYFPWTFIESSFVPLLKIMFHPAGQNLPMCGVKDITWTSWASEIVFNLRFTHYFLFTFKSLHSGFNCFSLNEVWGQLFFRKLLSSCLCLEVSRFAKPPFVNILKAGRAFLYKYLKPLERYLIFNWSWIHEKLFSYVFGPLCSDSYEIKVFHDEITSLLHLVFASNLKIVACKSYSAK